MSQQDYIHGVVPIGSLSQEAIRMSDADKVSSLSLKRMVPQIDERLATLLKQCEDLSAPEFETEALKSALESARESLEDINPSRALGIVSKFGDVLGCIRDIERSNSLIASTNDTRGTFLENAKDVAAEARSLISAYKAQQDSSLLQADGLVRSKVFFLPPELMRRSRELQGYHPEECDVLVIGAGPAGLSTTYNAGRLGLDTVVLEANYVGSTMSDSRAMPVKSMRTSAVGSSLARHGVAPEGLADEIGMPEMMKHTNLRQIAIDAREQIAQAKGYTFPEGMPTDQRRYTTSEPVTRGEVFGYFVEVAERANALENVFIAEQAPVSTIKWLEDQGRFEVKSAEGHLLRPKYVVFASGAVGKEAQFARSVNVLDDFIADHESSFLVAHNDRDLLPVLDQLEADIGGNGRQLVITDPLLGNPKVQEHLQALPDGTTVTFIGSGESAAKGALFVRSVNPNLKVDLFVRAKLEPSLGQNPAFGGMADMGVEAIRDPDFADLTSDIVKRFFGTPITPRSMQELLEGVSDGNIRVFELGTHFDRNVIELNLADVDAKSGVEIRLASSATSVRASLRAQEEEWREFGISQCQTDESDESLLSVADGPLILAAGYDRQELRSKDELFQSLSGQGVVTLSGRRGGTEVETDTQTGLFSARNRQIAFVGAANIQGPIDGVFSGGGLRGMLVAQQIALALGKISKLETPEILPVPTGRQLKPAIEDTIQNEKRVPGSRFPGSPHLISLARKHKKTPDALTSVERLLLKRADGLQTRINGILGPNDLTPL